jgi:hypothetical protein
LAAGKFLVFCQRTDKTLEAAHLLASETFGKPAKELQEKNISFPEKRIILLSLNVRLNNI